MNTAPTISVPLLPQLDWAAATTVALQPLSGDEGAPTTTVAVVADRDALWARFTCQATQLHAQMCNDGDPLYLEDVVELFLWPMGTQPAMYLEYEVSPLGHDLALLCCQRAGHFNRWRPWGAAATDRPRCHVTVSGGPQQPFATVDSWTAEMRIPFAALAGLVPPPTTGTIWRANAYRIDHHAGRPRHLAWQPPPMPRFHHLDTFGAFRFEEQPT